MEFNSLISTLEPQIKDLEFKLEKCLIKLKSNKFLSIDLSKSNQCEYKQHSLEKKLNTQWKVMIIKLNVDFLKI